MVAIEEPVGGQVVRVKDARLELVAKIARRSEGKPLIINFDKMFYENQRNLILFLCLIFLTRFSKVKKRLRAILIAATILFISHVLSLTLNSILVLEARYAGIGLASYSDRFMHVLAMVSTSYNTTIGPILPLALIAPVWLRRSKKKPSPMAKVGRNEPCPCGSGKKFKKCCER